MAKPDGRIEKGQRLSTAISARAWNRAQDAADIVLGVRPGVEADGPVSISAPFNRIKLRWLGNPGRVLKPYSFVGLNDRMRFFPDSTAEVWDGVPLYDASSLNVSFSRAGIAVPLEPISQNGIGWAAVCGAVPVRIDVKYPNDTHAMPFVRQYTSSGTAVPTPYTADTLGEWRLQSFPFAGYRIISCVSRHTTVTTAADDVWALVDLSSFWAQPLVLGKVHINNFSALGRNGLYLVSLAISDGDSPTQLNFYVAATTHTFRSGRLSDGTYVWMVNPYSMHLYNVSRLEPLWDIVAVDQEPWGVSAEGMPTKVSRANQSTWLPRA